MTKQDITGNGGANYTLSHAVSNANEIAVYVNNVRQEPTSAYTVNGTALNMTGNVASSDDFYVIYLGKAIQTVVPPDGSVGTAKLANSAVDLTSKVTGVLPVANGGTGRSVQGIDDNADATAITIDSNENVGINNTNPDQYVTTGKVLAIQGTANNSGAASLHMNGNADGAGYYNTQVFAITGITSATEIARFTGTGANGWRAYFKIIATGHTSTIANGINIKEYYYDGGTNTPVQISSYVATNAPVIAFNNATSDVLIITLSSSNGIAEFRGVVKIEAMIPPDFSGSTWTIS